MLYLIKRGNFMLKKILLLLFLLTNSFVLANQNDILVANIKYDWLDKNITEKEAIIEEVKEIMFEQGLTKIPDLKTRFKDFSKDKEYKKHYLAASAGHNEYQNYNISAFYYKNMKYIYMYALQDKNDISKAYYYDALGNLQYIDFIEGSYPEYPYYAIQYRTTGTPVSATYYASEDCQYIFKPNGEFKGVWYKHNLYDTKNKIILKRSTY